MSPFVPGTAPSLHAPKLCPQGQSWHLRVIINARSHPSIFRFVDFFSLNFMTVLFLGLHFQHNQSNHRQLDQGRSGWLILQTDLSPESLVVGLTCRCSFFIYVKSTWQQAPGRCSLYIIMDPRRMESLPASPSMIKGH